MCIVTVACSKEVLKAVWTLSHLVTWHVQILPITLACTEIVEVVLSLLEGNKDSISLSDMVCADLACNAGLHRDSGGSIVIAQRQ